MSLLRALTEKSWLPQPPAPQSDGGERPGAAPQRIALRFFLGIVFVLFTLFVTAYFVRRELADWRPMPESPLLWLNTGLLFVASLLLQWTRMMLNRRDKRQVQTGLLLGGAATFAFVAGQLMVWRDMSAAGYYLYSNPANSFFYVLTGLHALHILGGLWVWSRAGIRVFSGGEVEDVRLAVELCTVYWHFLLLVWLVLFALISYT